MVEPGAKGGKYLVLGDQLVIVIKVERKSLSVESNLDAAGCI